MMKFDQFMELVPEMKIQIVRKCYPVSYVRLRRSCRFMDEFCEENRSKLGIYCHRKRPCLYLLNSLNILPFKRNKGAKLHLDGVYVAINYGRNCGDVNFLVQMTSRNVEEIRNSLSGFAFYSISLANQAPADNYEENQKFNQALVYFLEATADFTSVKQLTTRNLTINQVKMITDAWKVEKIDLLQTGNMRELVAMDTAVPFVSYSTPWKDASKIDVELIQEAIKGKKYVDLLLWGLPASLALSALSSVSENWKNDALVMFSLSFESHTNIYNRNIFKEFDGLLGQGAVYFGCFSKFMRAANNPVTDFLAKKEKWDIWIKKFEDIEKWQIIFVRRTGWRAFTTVDFSLSTISSRRNLILSLIELLDDICPGNAMDYSNFYENMKNIETIDDVQREFRRLLYFMRYFYSKIYIKPILNTACEMMTEWWNWPRWILEFTKRRPIEKRPPIVDLGYVLFQEILCPIYQFCS